MQGNETRPSYMIHRRLECKIPNQKTPRENISNKAPDISLGDSFLD